MNDLGSAKVAILATNGFEPSELFEPKKQLEAAGAEVCVISQNLGLISSWKGNDWGKSIRVDKTIKDAEVGEFDALILPGGHVSPDLLREDDTAVSFIRDYFRTGKPLAAICHAPWLLIEAGVLEGRNVTSYEPIAPVVRNVGGNWQDSPVVVDRGLITSQRPADLIEFCKEIIAAIAWNQHPRRAA